jgi:hypothetical protein
MVPRVFLVILCPAVQAHTFQCQAVIFTGVTLLSCGVSQDVGGCHANLARDAACCTCGVVVWLCPAKRPPRAFDSIGGPTKHPGQTPARWNVTVKAIEGPWTVSEQPCDALSTRTPQCKKQRTMENKATSVLVASIYMQAGHVDWGIQVAMHPFSCQQE